MAKDNLESSKEDDKPKSEEEKAESPNTQNQSEYSTQSEKSPEKEVSYAEKHNDQEQKDEQNMDKNEQKMEERNEQVEKILAPYESSVKENNKTIHEAISQGNNKSEEESKGKEDIPMNPNKGKDTGKDQFDINKIIDLYNKSQISHHSLQTLESSTNNQQLKSEDQENRSKAVFRVRISSNSKVDQRRDFPNVLFFADEFKSNFGQSYFLSQLLERRGNNNILEMDHSYIQWIFPNKFKSMFNSESQPLSDQEIDIFIKNVDLSLKYIECYEMMLDFYGMRLIDKRTGELNRSIKPFPNDYKTRYYEAVCGHNCLRIRRILTSLNNLGFRRYAIQLVNFLKQEITEGNKPLEDRKWDFDYDWKQYGECTTRAEIKELEKQTFQKIDQLERRNILLILEDENYMKIQEKEDDFGIKG